MHFFLGSQSVYSVRIAFEDNSDSCQSPSESLYLWAVEPVKGVDGGSQGVSLT